MQCLIIFEISPESIKIYRAELFEQAKINAIRACHGFYVNAVGCPAEVEKTISEIDTFATLIYNSEIETTESKPVEYSTDGSTLEIIHTGMLL